MPEPARGLDEYADALRLHFREEPDDGRSLAYGPAPEPMPAHRLAFAGRRSAPPAAAAEAAARRDQALTAYNAADAQTLQRFFQGRIPAAISTAWVELQDWVRDIYAQISLAPASSGVGARIDVSVRKSLSPAVASIHRLTCEVADTDRTPRTAAAHRSGTAGPTADGRAGPHRRRPPPQGTSGLLAETTDIRTWITIRYMITQADGSQERWDARDVTVSQGESRLIVLAPMLAALAAGYRDLPTHTARLCALDEVPAEVDHQGWDAIAAHVASLDPDLICTSHHWDGSPGAWDGVGIY
ncbi:SbcC/MukB-like Walker B domain-containing protein [Streptomyces sp. NPDC014724]|uniref:SbcC/MukB-like Walker B domain-containing protein n=1 Tax=unclassified Streptomyces TaxID=2593676 RepID=UPI0036FEF8D3